MRGTNTKYNSYAFTEQGVSMLASVLKSETAVQTSIKIIDAFVAMRHFMQKNAKLFVEIDNIKQHLIQTDVHLNENDKKIEQVKKGYKKRLTTSNIISKKVYLCKN